MQSDIVQRLQEIRAFLDGSGELNGLSFGDRTVHPATGKPVSFWWRRELTALDEAAAEIARLAEALRLQMEAKHKEAAEAKLWFQKAQEWKEALRAAEEREKGLREALAFYARENSWRSCGMYMSGRPNPSSAELDAGNKARQALAGAKP